MRCPALPFVHWEIKIYRECQMTRPAQLRDWEAQARRDAGPEKLPVIAHRWLRSDWWLRVLPTSGRAPYWQTLEEFLADVTGSGRLE
ncbi:hypothetical protein [Deinococcus alpinitundrae]|uniref:hypothetical protein n=1 Tax=Deinococcus alpinitundrae TaxID=468913 RepID=UPI001ED94F8D|nr:hypothetical protein [Deinococcus alpinitundrae]